MSMSTVRALLRTWLLAALLLPLSAVAAESRQPFSVEDLIRLRRVSEPILATDAERDMALALLREASVDGRLAVEDLAQRAELVHASLTDEIKAQLRRYL